MNDAKALDAAYYELTGLVYDSEVTIVDEGGVERRIGYGELLVNGTIVMCDGGLYVYHNKYEQAPFDGWWDDVDAGDQLNVYVVLRSYLLGGLGDAFRVIRQPEVRD